MSNRTKLELPIEGMSCGSCKAHVEQALNALDGVHATVDLPGKRADVELDPARVTPEQLVDAVGAAGYTATLPQ